VKDTLHCDPERSCPAPERFSGSRQSRARSLPMDRIIYVILSLNLLLHSVRACFAPPANDTVDLAPRFLDAPGNNLIVDTIGNMQIEAVGPTVDLRFAWQMLVGGAPSSASSTSCGLNQAVAANSNCSTTITLSGNWTLWSACPGWSRSLQGGVVTMTNYVHLSWKDVLSGGQERLHSTSMRLVATLQADLVVESDAALYMDSARLVFTSIIYTPTTSTIDRRVEIAFTLLLPCPFTPNLIQAFLALLVNATDGSTTTWSPNFSGCVTGPIRGGGSLSSTCGTSSIAVNPSTCTERENVYNGTLTVPMETYCFADGLFNFTLSSASTPTVKISMSFLLEDEFDLCRADGFNASLTATLDS
jgi:hypothetical protein